MWLLVHVVSALLKIEWLIVFTVSLLLANRICWFALVLILYFIVMFFFLSLFLCLLILLYCMYVLPSWWINVFICALLNGYVADDLGGPLTLTLKKVKVKFSHTRNRALGPELNPVYRQSARHRPGSSSLPLLSARPAVTSVAFTRLRHPYTVAHTRFQLTTHLSTPKKMKGWVGLDG